MPPTDSLRKQLEGTNGEATKPIFEELDPKKYPTLFLTAVQMGNNAAYVKGQQPDKGSINMVLYEYHFKEGKWDQFGENSDNYLFRSTGLKSPVDEEGIKNKIQSMEDNYFSTATAVEMFEEMKNNNLQNAKKILSSTSKLNLEKLLKKYPFLQKNAGWNTYNYEMNISQATITMNIFGEKKTIAKFQLAKENGIWKVRDIQFELPDNK